jgi:transcriptional regulator with XRE-family HTH domain
LITLSVFRNSPIQIKRYESSASQPTFDVIRNFAIELKVSADELMFDEDERQPSYDLKLQFEAVSRFPEEEKKIVKAIPKEGFSNTMPNAG